jgi:hypothetical protein
LPGDGGGATIGGFQPPTGGNSLADADRLIIQDYESNLKIIDQIIERIDVRPIQVLIEAVIISVDWEHDRELGVNFAVTDNLANLLGEIGTGTALNGNVGFSPLKLLTANGTIAPGTPADPLGFTGGTNGIKFGFVSNNVTGFVRALETIGSTKILASPRILVLNKQRAEIQLGARLGFQTLSQNFTSTIQQVQFLNTGTLLRLRPFVSDDGMVRMEIHPERSSGTVVNNIPNQQTAELTTNVMVPDGATLVIGGLMEDEDDYQLQGLPILSRIPALGYLFGARQKTEGRRELVVLLTPHIWSADLAMAHAPTPHFAGGAPGDPRAGRSPMSFDLSRRRDTDGSVPGDPPAPPGPMVIAGGAAVPLAGAGSSGTNGGAAGAAGPSSGQDERAAAPSRWRPWGSLRQLLSRRTGEPNPPMTRVAVAPADPAVTEPPGRLAPRESTSAPPSPGKTTGARRRSEGDGQPQGSGVDLDPYPPASAPTNTSDRRTEITPPVTQAAWTAKPISSAGQNEEGVLPAGETARSGPVGLARLRPGAVAAGPRRHTVSPGESFDSIAAIYYGSARYEDALWQYNRGRFPRPEWLAAGDVLVVPPVRELGTPAGHIGFARSTALNGGAVQAHAGDARLELPGSSESRAGSLDPDLVRAGNLNPDGTARSMRTAVDLEPRRELAIHVVQRYETVRSIARDRLGDARRAGEIIELNAGRVGESTKLTPGQRLLLPEDAMPPRQAP